MITYQTQYSQHEQSTYACQYLLVWCPKYRRPVLTAPIAARLRELVGEVCATHKAVIHTLTIASEHVELVVEAPPQVSIHLLQRRIKARSSAVLRREFPMLRSRLSTLWTQAYFVTTLPGSPQDVVQQFVDDQKYV